MKFTFALAMLLAATSEVEASAQIAKSEMNDDKFATIDTNYKHYKSHKSQKKAKSNKQDLRADYSRRSGSRKYARHSGYRRSSRYSYRGRSAYRKPAYHMPKKYENVTKEEVWGDIEDLQEVGNMFLEEFEDYTHDQELHEQAVTKRF